MAAFAKTTFNAQAYAAARPTYPRQLFDFVTRYHEYGGSSFQKRIIKNKNPKARWALAVDLGCGTGQATVELSHFARVIGVDPGKAMLDKARLYVTEHHKNTKRAFEKGKFEFVESPAEDLEFLQDGTVDLVIAAQAAHWFNWKKLWPELARVLRRDGTVAIWGYSEMRLTRYPSVTPLINAFMQGTDPETSLGPHWQQPGRNIVEDLLQAVPDASSAAYGDFYAEQRIYFSGPHHPSVPNPRPVILRKKMSWEDFETYLRSFSSLHTFQAKYPRDAEHPEGDIAKRFIRDLKAGMHEADAGSGSGPGESAAAETHVEAGESADSDGYGYGDGDGDGRVVVEDRSAVVAEDTVEVEWPLVLILAKRV